MTPFQVRVRALTRPGADRPGAACAGCHDPCAGHGGIASQGGGWTYCNDGTQVAGYG